MNALIMLVLIVAGLAILGVVAATLGVDSRIDSRDPHAPADPVGLS